MLTIEDQTGWYRSHPRSLCRDGDVLRSVFVYSYDILDVMFIGYCGDRGILWRLPDTPSTYWDALVDFNATEGEAIRSLGNTAWRDVGYFRGMIQDCWQLYLSRVE